MGKSSLDGVARGTRRYSSMANSRPVLRTVDFHGIPVSIEFDKGDTKRGVGEYGNLWTQTYEVPYGEIPGSRTLADGEGVDVYLGPEWDAPMVFVVHQLKRDGRTFDEDKVMLGFANMDAAVEAYKDHGPEWGFGSCDAMTVDEFLNGYLASNRKIA